MDLAGIVALLLCLVPFTVIYVWGVWLPQYRERRSQRDRTGKGIAESRTDTKARLYELVRRGVLTREQAKIKARLYELVRRGVLTREQANAIFAEAVLSKKRNASENEHDTGGG